MASTASLYGKLLISLGNKEVDMSNGTTNLKVMLCSSSYSPSQDSDQYVSDVSGEVSGTGYSSGGKSLANVAVSYSAGSNTMTLDADDVTWSGSTITARYAVIYDDTESSESDKALIAYVDFGGDKSSTSADFTLAWDSSGIVSGTVS